MSSDITALLQRHREGDDDALTGLLSMAYDELHGVAARAFRREGAAHTLQPTALLHEAWLKLAGNLDLVRDRQHFFAVAARAMRQVLADHARKRGTAKRGGGVRPQLLEDDVAGTYETSDLVALDDSLNRLAELNERHARVVELRIFGALTVNEAADELGVSRSTVETDWVMARAWLRRELAS
jgi:RNA polymerase sigma-70 factor (ECF subfamily)